VADSNGESKGYGFVHYDSDEAANKAIARVNGMNLAGKTVYVAPFVPKQARQQGGAGQATFTNLYIKNLPESVQTEDDLTKFVESYGELTSVWLATETLTRAALAQRKADELKRKAARAEKKLEAAKDEKKTDGGDDEKKADDDDDASPDQDEDAAHAEREAADAAKVRTHCRTNTKYTQHTRVYRPLKLPNLLKRPRRRLKRLPTSRPARRRLKSQRASALSTLPTPRTRRRRSTR
jgi:hypothetical protein